MDTYTLSLKNFRSLEDVKLEIAPLTVIYGPNGSGKSSLIYGLITLKNFLSNPNQNISSLFSYPYMSLGGLKEVIHRHSTDQDLTLSIEVSGPDGFSSDFVLKLNESGGSTDIHFDRASIRQDSRITEWPHLLSLQIAVPYTVNQQVEEEIELNLPYLVGMDPDDRSISGTISWNGTGVALRTTDDVTNHVAWLERVVERANLPMQIARHTGFVPLRRGFSKPSYGLSTVTASLASEDEVASLLASPDEHFRQYEISGIVEKIAGRRIHTQAHIGTSMFSIDSIPKDGGVAASIVNEGFGINQLLYMLTVCLYSPFKIVAVEEPEIHLHPSMVRELALVMAEIASTKGRRLIVSTHSEAFVIALLAAIASGKLQIGDVSFVLAQNQDGTTVLTNQEATAEGQLAGGLGSFMAYEAEDLMAFMKVADG